MHISELRESQNTILTKCAKMNEDSHKRLSINGNSDGTVVKVKEEISKNVYVPPAAGGRLKFFKDGKFILELERAKEGERVSWVSVPRKTFWPPQGVASSVTCKQESSTSLSISDDNSSIQSSPWQRDHFWKQTTPRRNTSKAMCFYFWRPKSFRVLVKSKKSRRPYCILTDNDIMKSACNSDSSTETNTCNRKVKKSMKKRSLLVTVQNLIDKNVSKTPPRVDTVVSPRKRFLRDMEKEKTISEENGQKRIKNKTTGVQASTSIGTTGDSSPLRINGHSEEKPQVSVASSNTQKNCSYSITSLLAEDRAPPRHSPNNSPSHFVPVATHKNFNSHSIKSEEQWYSESVEKFRSIELSHPEKSSFHTFPHHSYLPPFVYPYSFPTCYSYNRAFPPIPPPMYHHPPAHHLPVSMIRQEAPSCSWKTERVEHVDHHKEDTSSSDMPLNLSKHAG
ncbi:hypothetical protein WA026_004963 [Henosepilachna vigintioctopunctata]|uniref:Protein hairless n=1 Tax=Henosepilachna vigintioctopunctata TaxID=420089 RepID=A0AAW1UVP4_9CUCU